MNHVIKMIQRAARQGGWKEERDQRQNSSTGSVYLLFSRDKPFRDETKQVRISTHRPSVGKFKGMLDVDPTSAKGVKRACKMLKYIPKAVAL